MGYVMKKQMILVLAVTAVLPLIADTEKVGDYTWTYRVTDGKAEIVSYDNWGNLRCEAAISPSPVGPVTIPSTLGGRTVTSIGNYAFYNCSHLTSISIPNSVTNIGSQAFSGCSGLTSVTLPSSLKVMGDSCFLGCAIASILIPDGVPQIPEKCFADCQSLQSVSLPNSVTVIGDYAFGDYNYGCASLRQISLPTSVKTIGSGAFSQSGLTEIVIPSGVTSIGSYAFYGCESLGSAWMADSVLSVGESAFASCNSLRDVRLSKGLTSIAAYTFYYSGLGSVIIPGMVESLGKDSFYCSYIRNDWGDDEYLTNVIFCGSAPAGIENSKILENATSVYYPMVFASSYLQYVPQSIHVGYTESLDLGDDPSPATTYTVVFDSNGGSGTMSNQSFTIGTAQALRANAFYKVGFGFAGWAISANGGAVYSDAQIVRDLTSINGGIVRLYAVWSASGSGGGTVLPDTNADVSYTLSNAVADRTIASITVSNDCAIDSFVLKEGKVYDTVLRIVNTSNHAVRLTLPSGYTYETFEGVDPLTIPANSRNLLSITRTADATFLVSRERLKVIQ